MYIPNERPSCFGPVKEYSNLLLRNLINHKGCTIIDTILFKTSPLSPSPIDSHVVRPMKVETEAQKLNGGLRGQCHRLQRSVASSGHCLPLTPSTFTGSNGFVGQICVLDVRT